MPFSPSLAIVCLPSSDSHSLCLFRCKCHPRKEERRRAHNFGVLDSIQKVYFSLFLSPPFFLYFFFQPPFKQGTRNSGRRTAILPVCVYLCGIDLTSKPPREEKKEKRFVSFYRRRNTERERKRERGKESRNGGKCNESKQNYSLLPAG
jgi:hypothetical protein